MNIPTVAHTTYSPSPFYRRQYRARPDMDHRSLTAGFQPPTPAPPLPPTPKKRDAHKKKRQPFPSPPFLETHADPPPSAAPGHGKTKTKTKTDSAGVAPVPTELLHIVSASGAPKSPCWRFPHARKQKQKIAQGLRHRGRKGRPAAKGGGKRSIPQ